MSWRHLRRLWLVGADELGPRPEISRCCITALANGTSFGARMSWKCSWRKRSLAVLSIEMVLIVSSGTEATMSAITPRGYQSRQAISSKVAMYSRRRPAGQWPGVATLDYGQPRRSRKTRRLPFPSMTCRFTSGYGNCASARIIEPVVETYCVPAESCLQAVRVGQQA